MVRNCMLTKLLHANNKNALQHAHPRNLISAFDIHSLYITIANLPSFKETKSATMNIFQFFFIFFLNHL